MVEHILYRSLLYLNKTLGGEGIILHKIGSMYICGRSEYLMKVKVNSSLFHRLSHNFSVQARQGDVEVLVLDSTDSLISLQLYVI